MSRALKFFLGFILTIVCYSIPFAEAQPKVKKEDVPKGVEPRLAISPPRVEIDLDPARPMGNGAITLVNVSDTEVTVQASLENWDLDERNQYRALPPTEKSLDQWLIVNPLRVTLEPRQTQTIRVAARPRAKPEQGEYRAMVFFREIKASEENKTDLIKTDFSFVVGVPVYVNVGDIKRDVEVKRIWTDALGKRGVIAMELLSKGTNYARVEGRYAVWERAAFIGYESALKRLSNPREFSQKNMKGAIAFGPLNATALLPGSQRVLPTLFNLPKVGADYILVYQADIGGMQINDKIEFTGRVITR